MPSSAQIKQLLVDHFQAQGTSTTKGEWKRTKKHKDDQGQVRRVFQHPVLGAVAVVDTPQGIEIETTIAVGTTKKFVRPVWEDASIQAADRLIGAILDGDLEAEEAANHPDYLAAYASLPSLFSFSFPKATYGNEGQKNQALQDSFGELCIQVESIVDSDSGDYLPSVIQDRLEGAGLVEIDEDYWGLEDTGEAVSIEAMVQRLLAMGLTYNPNDCMLARQLTAAGAAQPSTILTPQEDAALTQVKQSFLQALVGDEVGRVRDILEQVPHGVLADVGDGRTWARAAYEAQAFESLSFLLDSGAPVFGPTDRKELMDGYMGRVWRENPAKAKDILRSLVNAKGWDPEHALTNIHFTTGQRARDEWAKTAWPDHLAATDPWLEEAWDLLATRAGDGVAKESFVHVWCMHAFRGMGGPPVPALIAQALTPNTTFLDTWPIRGYPRRWQALTKWCESSAATPILFEVSRALGVDLPNLKPVGLSEETFLEWARSRQTFARKDLERDMEQSRVGFIMTTYHDGRTTTQEQESRDRWEQAMALQKALEQWDRPAKGAQLGP